MIKKFLIIFSGLLIFAGIINNAEAKVNVGIVSPVKNKVKQLKDNKDKDQQNVVVNANHPPTITSVVANPTSVSTGAVSIITCTASDPDGDTLSYTWSATGGTISGSGSSVSWTAPNTAGTYTINVAVSDGYGGSVQGSTSVVVNTVSNNLELYFPLHQGDWWQWGDNESVIMDYETNKGYQNGYWLFVSTEESKSENHYHLFVSTLYYIVDPEGLKFSHTTELNISSSSYYDSYSGSTTTYVDYDIYTYNLSSPILILKNSIIANDVYNWNGEAVDSDYYVWYQYENGILVSSDTHNNPDDRYIEYSTITVLSLNASTTTPAGTFTNCLLLKEEIRDEYDSDYDTSTVLTYFAPNIGEVAELYVWSEPFLHQLLSYHTYSGGSGPLSVKTASVFSTQSLTNNNEVKGNLSKKRRILNRIKYLHPSFIRK